MSEVPQIQREEKLGPYLDAIRILHSECKGNLIRVHEELERREQVVVPYSTLTAFCRRHGIGVTAPKRTGHYHFEFGEEMQHDTSPHTVVIGGRKRKLQCASLVFCASRMIFAMLFVRWRRIEARIFLAKAIEALEGACTRCMIDNSSVIIASGTGKYAIPAAEMIVLQEHFGFEFVAHAVGDANRSARVERPFDFIEKNFYPGRTFTSLADANLQFSTWCDDKNAMFRKRLQAKPTELFMAERLHLQPLPAYIPDAYQRYTRRVDVDGYINLHVNRYSVPEKLIGRQVEVREYHESVVIFDGYKLAAKHDILEPGLGRRCTLEEHKHPGRKRQKQRTREAILLQSIDPVLEAMVLALEKHHGGRAVRPIRHLHRMYLDYPTKPLVDATSTALDYGLLDLKRVERMVLRNIAGDVFRLPLNSQEDS